MIFFLTIYTVGSYAPMALAGATYGVWLGWFSGYLLVNIGSACNLFLVRKFFQSFCAVKCMKRLQRINIESLETLFRHQPTKSVILLRLPILASGIMNYVFSLSPNLSAKTVIVGNLIGYLPGNN